MKSGQWKLMKSKPSISVWRRLLCVSLWSPGHQVAVWQREHLQLLWSGPGVYSRSVPAQKQGHTVPPYTLISSSSSVGCFLAALFHLLRRTWLLLLTWKFPGSRQTTYFHSSQQSGSIKYRIFMSIFRWHFCDDPSVNLSDQNLFCISPGSLIFLPVGGLHLLNPVGADVSGSQQGVGHYRRFQVRHLETGGCPRQQSRHLSEGHEEHQCDFETNVKWSLRLKNSGVKVLVFNWFFFTFNLKWQWTQADVHVFFKY